MTYLFFTALVLFGYLLPRRTFRGDFVATSKTNADWQTLLVRVRSKCVADSQDETFYVEWYLFALVHQPSSAAEVAHYRQALIQHVGPLEARDLWNSQTVCYRGASCLIAQVIDRKAKTA